MIDGLVKASIRFRLLVLPAAVALVVLGVLALQRTPVDVLPEYQRPFVEVQTESLGLSAAEVEQLITVPLEQDLLNGIQGVETIRSDSIPGLSSVDLIFERGTDILRARQLVQERLTQAHALPNVSAPPQMIQPVSATGRVMMIGLSSDRLTPIELSVLARWTVRPRLMGLEGVANVAIWGQRERQLQVQVDPERLRRHGVTLFDVIKTTGNAQLVSPLTFLDASTPGTGGFIDGPNQRLGVRHILPFGKPSDLAQVPVARRAGGPLPLGAVATVVEDHQPLIGDAVVGGGRGLMLVVDKLPGASTLAVTHRIERALDELRPGMRGVRVDATVFRPATFLERALHHLAWIGVAAAALALLALMALLRGWRPALVCAVAIPTSLIAALLVLQATSASINALTIAGLAVALAILVDDAVADTENIARRFREDRAAGAATPAGRLVAAASVQTRRPLGYATLIVLLAMLPVFFTSGQTGAFVHPLALAYVAAVLASLAVALVVTPALASLLLARGGTAGSPVTAAIERAFLRVFSRSVRSPRPALLAAAVLAALGIVAVARSHQDLRPHFGDRQLLARVNADPSISLPEMERITARAARELRTIPGVRDVGAHVGRAVTSDQPVGTGSGQLWLTIAGSADLARTTRAIKQVIGGYPGLRGSVLSYEDDRSRGVLGPPDDGLLVRVYGQELGVLRGQAERLRRELAGVRGVQRPRVLAPAMQPTLQIQVDLATARRYGIKPGDVRRAAAALVAGIEVGSFFEQQKVFQVVVRGDAATRDSVASVRRLLIDRPGGGHVRIGDVADVRLTPNPVDIRHDSVSRYIDVRAGVRGRGVASVRDEVRDRLRRASFPYEYHAEVITPSDDVVAPAGRFPSLVVAAALGILLVLQAALGSWRLAAIVFAALPLALAGSLAVILARGRDVGLGEAVALFAVFGLAARNAIALVRRAQELHDAGGKRDGGGPPTAAVVRATRERLPAIVTSAAVTGAAMAVLVVAGDVAGNEITRPMAAVVLGGLVTATALNLWILPALYLHFGAARRRPVAEVPDRPPPSLELVTPHADPLR
jgi:Cu/Ag efflux pump CusA